MKKTRQLIKVSKQSRVPPNMLCVALLFLVVSFNPSCTPWRGDGLETWETTNDAFRVRITAYNEKGGWVGLPHTYYVFESSPADLDRWREFMMLRHDDQIGIPKEQVRLVNDKLGYVFMGWMFNVTTDGGNTWSVWDNTREIADWNWSDYGRIVDVKIERDGTGTMMLKPTDRSRNGRILTTEDFGRHWAISESSR